MTLQATPDQRLVRVRGGSARHVQVRVVAPRSRRAADERAPLNVALVLDRSGSMSGEKIAHAKAALRQMLARLRDPDRLALVVYDSKVEVLLPSQPATAEARAHALRVIDAIEAGSTTALFDGWLRGCQEVARALADEQVARCLLLSDGLANVGLTDREAIAGHAAALAARRVSTSTFGVGSDYDEVLLARMAAEGRGTFYYIAEARQIGAFVAQELGELEEAVARDVVLRVAAPHGAEVRCLGAFPVHRAGGAWQVPLGTLVDDQVLEFALRVDMPPGEPGAEATLLLTLEDRNGMFAGACEAVRLRYADDAEVDAEPHDPDVAAFAARLRAETARRQALEYNAAGDWERARARLREEAARMTARWAGDPAVEAIARELRAAAEHYRRRLGADERKRIHATSTAWLASRDLTTSAARRADREHDSTPP